MKRRAPKVAQPRSRYFDFSAVLDAAMRLLLSGPTYCQLVLVRFNQSNIKKVNNINLTGPAPNCYATPNFFRSPSGLLFLQLPGLDVAVLRPIHPLKEDVVAFRVEGVGIALQDERFVGHLVNRLDQVRIDGVSSLGIGGVWKE